MTVKNMLRRVTAGTGALMLALAGGVAAGTAASAATVGPDQPNAPDAGTLTINLYEGETGQDLASLQGKEGLSGIEFTVTQVGRMSGGTCAPIDLTVAGQWTGLDALFASAPAAPAGDFCATDTKQVKVTEAGQVTFDLGVGVYFVEETGHGDNNVVSEVPNFYASIPTSEGTSGNGWNYNVVANPKNQLMGEPSKVISERPDALTVGSNVEWTITIPVPSLNNNETFNEAVITDSLDLRLSLVEGSTSLTVGSTTLTEGTHFDVSGNAVWTLNAAGRQVLDANMSGTMTLTFDTTVNSIGGDGAIANTTDNYYTTFNGTTVNGNTSAYAYWGQMQITKIDDSAEALPLQGAEFQVYEPVNNQCSTSVPETGLIATGVSGDDGIVAWDHNQGSSLGLWVANSNDGPADPTPSKDYCVYETVVPAGHTGVAIDNPVTITPGEESINVFEVVNAKTEGPNLPLTGAQGTILMTVAGILLVVLGGGGMYLARRKKS